jgi:hypothetical protein
MLGGLSQRRAELLARAVRDHLADCLSTLPALIERGVEPSIHFYFANLEGLRRSLFPRLTAAYTTWRKTGDEADLRLAYLDGQTHWREAARRMLATWQGDPTRAERVFSGWVDEHGPLML